MNRETVAENRLLCEEVLNCLPEYCDTCGSEIHFDDGLRMFCSNDDCPSKLAERIYTMARYLQVDGFGVATNLELIKHLNLKSPLDLFYFNTETDDVSGLTGGNIDKLIKLQEVRLSKKFQLSDIVKMAGLEGINTLADKIFKGYDSFENFYKDLDEQGPGLLAEKLVVSGKILPIVMAVYERLITEQSTFLRVEEDGLFKMESLDGKVVEIAITGRLANGMTKKNFITKLNNKLKPKYIIVLANSVTYSVNVLISDDEDATSTKMKTALKLKEKGHDIEIVSSKKFEEMMDALMKI